MLTAYDNGLRKHYEYFDRISKFSNEILPLLLACDKPAAQAKLNNFSAAYDDRGNATATIALILQMADTVINKTSDRNYPQRSSTAADFHTLNQQDEVLANLLEMKVIWPSVYLFNNLSIAQLPKMQQTLACRLQQAILSGDDKALSLIDEYFTWFDNDKFRVDIASQILEDVLYRSCADKNTLKLMAKKLLGYDAQTSDIDGLNAIDSTRELAKIKPKTTYRYLTG